MLSRLHRIGNAGARRAFATAPAKELRLNFYLPHAVIAQDEVIKQVMIPSVDGVYGVLAGHVPIVSELKPGVVQVFTSAEFNVELTCPAMNDLGICCRSTGEMAN
jgi:F-type H+-transporting ATPase subunit delta